jgi:acyl carrier protein
MNLLEEINEIFKDVLDNNDIRVTYTTKSDDIEEWDSLNHIQLVVAIEKKFKIKFNATQIHKWNDVGEMIDDIKKMIE